MITYGGDVQIDSNSQIEPGVKQILKPKSRRPESLSGVNSTTPPGNKVFILCNSKIN
jgi:hypothetical protein